MHDDAPATEDRADREDIARAATVRDCLVETLQAMLAARNVKPCAEIAGLEQEAAAAMEGLALAFASIFPEETRAALIPLFHAESLQLAILVQAFLAQGAAGVRAEERLAFSKALSTLFPASPRAEAFDALLIDARTPIEKAASRALAAPMTATSSTEDRGRLQ
jgi:hypothetical protein